MMGSSFSSPPEIPRTMPVAASNLLDRHADSRNQDQLRLLFEVSEAVASHRDLTELFRDLARRLPAIVPFEVIALFLHDPEKDVMRVHMLGTAEADRIPPGLEVPVGDSYSGLVFTTQQPVVVRTPEDETRFPNSQSLVKQIGVESFCMLPLTTIVRRLGAIGFGSLRPCAFGDSELEFLGHVARQVAVAVDNVLHDESTKTTRQELSQERDRLRLLLEVSESIASYRDLRELFEVLSQRLPRLVPFDFINLVLHDPARDVMRLEILATGEPSSILPGRETPVDQSPSGIVWKTQQPLMVSDLLQETRFPGLTPLLLENGVRSYCAVPLTSALRRLGALGFGSMRANAYGEADLEFMQHVAKQVAVAVDNVLHDKSARSAQNQLARERDRLQLLLDVNNAVVAHLGMEQMLAAVGASLARVIEHDGCGLVLYDPETRQYRCHVLKSNGEQFTEEGCADADDDTPCPADGALMSMEPAVLGEQELRAHADESQFLRKLLEKGVKSFCRVPLRSHNRVLGSLNAGRLRDAAFTPEDVELLGQVAQQVAIAVENGLAYREIAELKEKLSTEKLYLEEEIRTDAELRRDHRRQPGAQAGAAPGRDCRVDRFDGPDSGRDGHRQGADRAGHPQPERPQGPHVREAQLRRDSDRACSRASSSVTRKARSRAPSRRRWAASSWPTAARCFSTRSATSRSSCNRSSCACSRSRSSSGSAGRGRSASTCG